MAEQTRHNIYYREHREEILEKFRRMNATEGMKARHHQYYLDNKERLQSEKEKNKPTIICDNCGKAKQVPKKRFNRLVKVNKNIFCSQKCYEEFRIKTRHPSSEGNKTITRAGYVLVNIYSNHPYFSMATCRTELRGVVLEHRLVMAKHLGRSLTKYEFVHHINENKADNGIENLALVDKHTHSLITKMETEIENLKRENESLRRQIS